jgi:hypothetical protein
LPHHVLSIFLKNFYIDQMQVQKGCLFSVPNLSNIMKQAI